MKRVKREIRDIHTPAEEIINQYFLCLNNFIFRVQILYYIQYKHIRHL